MLSRITRGPAIPKAAQGSNMYHSLGHLSSVYTQNLGEIGLRHPNRRGSKVLHSGLLDHCAKFHCGSWLNERPHFDEIRWAGRGRLLLPVTPGELSPVLRTAGAQWAQMGRSGAQMGRLA